MFALPMPRAARWQREAWQAVQNHHKRQEMRKQIARRDERKKKLLSPMLEVCGGVGGTNGGQNTSTNA